MIRSFPTIILILSEKGLNSVLPFLRQILMEGPLQLLDSGKAVEMFVILFDDMLLITRQRSIFFKYLVIGLTFPIPFFLTKNIIF